jgi:hypothetical protein
MRTSIRRGYGLEREALAGAVSGFAGTFVLTGLRRNLDKVGIIDTSAPEQVVRRIEELGLLESWSPKAWQALTVAAHFGYGVGDGVVFGRCATRMLGCRGTSWRPGCAVIVKGP